MVRLVLVFFRLDFRGYLDFRLGNGFLVICVGMGLVFCFGFVLPLLVLVALCSGEFGVVSRLVWVCRIALVVIFLGVGLILLY